MDKWKLIKCEHLDWQQDKSGYYVWVISLDGDLVRLDVMGIEGDVPAISFQGTSEDVRKTFSRYAEKNCWNLSFEHLTYIGSELTKAAIHGGDYVQD